MPKTPNEILNDPNFYKIPLGSQLNVMRSVDPNFASLDPKVQGTILYKAHAAVTGNTPPPEAQAPEDAGYFSTLGNDIKGFATTVTPQGPGEALLGPVPGLYRLGKAALKSHVDTAERAYKELKSGDVSEGTFQALASLAPVIGPVFGTIEDEVSKGQFGQAAAHLTEIFTPDILEGVGKSAGALGKGAKLAAKAATSPAGRDAIGMIHPGLKHGLDLAARGKNAWDKFTAPDEEAAAPKASASRPKASPPPIRRMTRWDQPEPQPQAPVPPVRYREQAAEALPKPKAPIPPVKFRPKPPEEAPETPQAPQPAPKAAAQPAQPSQAPQPAAASSPASVPVQRPEGALQHPVFLKTQEAINNKVSAIGQYLKTNGIRPETLDQLTPELRNKLADEAHTWAKSKGLAVPKQGYRGMSNETLQMIKDYLSSTSK